jgi:transcriptional regulator with XRE-family HTH domain
MTKTLKCPTCEGKGSIDNPIFTGQKMRTLREGRGLTLRSMAGKVGISLSYLTDLEHGRRNWSPELIAKCHKALEI